MTLHNAIIEALQQVLELIDVAQHRYNETPELALSPIGKHVRHIVDHFWAFQEGITTGQVDYNLRHRETALEQEPQLAINAIEEFNRWLKLQSTDNGELTVISEFSVSQTESITTPSNIHRELVYLINHTLHHAAYAVVLAKGMGLEPPAYIGVAPATASYMRAQQAECVQ